MRYRYRGTDPSHRDPEVRNGPMLVHGAIDQVSGFLPYNPHNHDFRAWLQKKEPGDGCR